VDRLLWNDGGGSDEESERGWDGEERRSHKFFEKKMKTSFRIRIELILVDFLFF
jgi:hypothetical protein